MTNIQQLKTRVKELEQLRDSWDHKFTKLINNLEILRKENETLRARLDNGRRISEVIRLLLGKPFDDSIEQMTKLYLAE